MIGNELTTIATQPLWLASAPAPDTPAVRAVCSIIPGLCA